MQQVIRNTVILSALAVVSCALVQAGSVDIHPGNDIPTIVAQNPAGTTFIIYPGTYRLQAHIVPKTGDSFIGQTACAPPKTSCPAILSGSRVIGSLAKLNGMNYEVTGQTQQGQVNTLTKVCLPGYLACNRPEDLFFDGVPYRHLYASSLPAIGKGQWWFDYANHTIYFHDNPSGHTVETSVLDTAFDSTANNVTIQYLTVKGFASPLQRAGIEASSGNVFPTSSANWVIKNCELYDNHGSGVRIAFGTQILNSYIHNNGSMGIGGGTQSMTSSRVIIQGNTISNNNYANVVPAFAGAGVKFGYTAGVVLRKNVITNNLGGGIKFDTSSSAPLIDGNTITDNVMGAGIAYEISLNSAIVRNNQLLRNSLPGSVAGSAANVGSYDSTGVSTYCNVIEVPNIGSASGAIGTSFVGSNRGYNPYPPYQYYKSTGNSFHHNTVIWDAGSRGPVGYFLSDAAHQPNFFSVNVVPDYNTYHLPSLSSKMFVYDNNTSQANAEKTFTEYQAAGADVHGSADTNYDSGYPSVTIASPVDQSSFASSVSVNATASDKSGINRVEFYVDWKLEKTVAGTPYSFDWTNATVGQHTVAAMAYSNAGISACYAVTLTKQ